MPTGTTGRARLRTRNLADMQCPACGTTAPTDARFCPSCGQALVARPDERRVATVLFADLVGFTALSETADPEHVKNLVDRCFERLVADVTAFGGQVDKIVGDALVALFGAPVAHEDDAERAVRAALRMQETLGRACAARPASTSRCASASTPARCSSARCAPAATTPRWATS